MAGLISVTRDGTKNMSIGQLDQLMDEMVSANKGKMEPIQALTVPLAFRAVDMIAGAISRMPYYIEDASENDKTDEATPRYWKGLQYNLAASLLLFNGAYALPERNRFGVQSFRFLPSPLVSYEVNNITNALEYFEYRNGAQSQRIMPNKIMWWWWPNLTSEVGPGSGPINAALEDIGLASSLTRFASSYFARGGFPLTILSSDGVISEPEKVLSWWNAMVRGARNAFKAILLTNKITPTVIGSNIKDTIAPELYQQAAHNVSIAFGIPLSLLLSDAANYATALGDHVRFYTETVIPLAERMFEVWNERVFEPQGLTIETNPDELEIMQAYQLETAAAVVAVVGKPVLTVDEGRAILGYDPLGDDTFTQPAPVAAPSNAEQTDTAPTDTGETDTEMAERDDAIDDERGKLKRYAHKRLGDGKPFAFRSDIISTAEIEAVKALTTHEAIDALDFKHMKYDDNQPRDEYGMWTDTGGSIEDYTRKNPHSISSGKNAEQRADEFRKLSDDDYVVVFHATDNDNADKILKSGTSPSTKPSTALGDGRFSPGHGLSTGLSVGTDPVSVSGYGKRILAVRVKKSSISAPPEQAQFGAHVDPAKALSVSDAIVNQAIPASSFIDVTSSGRYVTGYDSITEYRKKKQAKSVDLAELIAVIEAARAELKAAVNA